MTRQVFGVLSVVAVVGSLFLVGAAIAQEEPVTYAACLDEKKGELTNVGLDAPVKSCKDGEVLISWNSIGPRGPQGLQGIQGVQGEVGPVGPQGPSGEDGQPCVVVEGPEGTFTLTCPDGSSVVWIGEPTTTPPETTTTLGETTTTVDLWPEDAYLYCRYWYNKSISGIIQSMTLQFSEDIFRGPFGWDVPVLLDWDTPDDTVNLNEPLGYNGFDEYYGQGGDDPDMDRGRYPAPLEYWEFPPSFRDGGSYLPDHSYYLFGVPYQQYGVELLFDQAGGLGTDGYDHPIRVVLLSWSVEGLEGNTRIVECEKLDGDPVDH